MSAEQRNIVRTKFYETLLCEFLDLIEANVLTLPYEQIEPWNSILRSFLGKNMG